MSGLPTGWEHAPLETIANVQWGDTSITKKSYVEDGYTAFSATGPDGNLANFQFEQPGIVLSAIGARCGRCFVADGKWSAIKNTITITEIGVERDLLFHLLNVPGVWPKKGGAQPFITLGAARKVMIPIPPASEQRRIVEALDRHFARTRQAREELVRIPTLIKHYKEAILRQAFSGELTADWWERSNHCEIISFPSDGIDGRSADLLEELPTSWCWTSMDQLADISGGLTKNRKRAEIPTTVPYLRVANVYANELRLDEIKEIGCTESELEKTRLETNDLLVVEGNGSIEQIGRVALWSGLIDPCSHQNHLIRARSTNHVPAKFLLYWLLSPRGRVAIERVASSSAGLHTLSISKVSGIPTPATSSEEAELIVSRIEHAMQWLAVVEAEHAKATELLDHMDQALLAKAFRGELVPQDPADEPASVLLGRIRTERDAQPKAKRGRKKKAA